MSQPESIQDLRGSVASPLDAALDTQPSLEETSKPLDATPVPAAIKGEEEVETLDAPEEKPFESPFDNKNETEEGTDNKDENLDADKAFEEETEREIEEMNKAPHPGEAFRKVKGKLKERDAIIQDLENKIKSFEAGDIESSPEYEKIKAKLDSYDEIIKQNQELSQKVAAVDYRETADYKTQIIAPYDDISALAATLSEKTGIDKSDIMNAVSQRDYSAQSNAIEDLKENLDDRSYSTLIKMADEMTILYQKEAQLEANASTLLEQSRSASESLAAQERERNEVAYKKAVGSTFDTYQDQIPLFIADDGTESPLSKSLRDQAFAVDFDGMSADQKAFAAMSAVSLAPMITKYRELSKKLAAFSARDVISDSLTPKGVSTPAPSSSSKPSSYLREGESPSDAMNRIIDGMS